ncbi:DUF1987 domain-containing protein [Bacteroidales bacterium]|nr:DUF1987 domain-containing protein [Bacteroidales bacterium]
MKDYILEKTKITPSVNCNAEKGEFTFEGRSIPEDSIAFFEPIIEWLDEYFKSPCQTTTLNFRLDYINSGSSKYLLSIFKNLTGFINDSTLIIVNWYYEEDDETIIDLGEHYKTTFPQFTFNLKMEI